MTTVRRFTLAYLVAFAAFSAGAGERRAAAYFVAVATAAAVVRVVHGIAPFTTATCWALSVAGLLHLVGGLLPSPQDGAPVFYETWLVPGLVKYDQLVHFTVSGVVTFAAWELVQAWTDDQRCGPVARAVVAALMALGCGALNEAIEFLSALRFADAYVGGLENTGWDLVFNGFGALSAAVWLAVTAAGSTAPVTTVVSATPRSWPPRRPGATAAAPSVPR